ncbi:histidine kinase [Lewinella sp. W8]|uniref:histidine kinase n=1 Tax=Lewinella sp. W8 TaxID=2528208 RepID=UPI0010681816|nr:histidine kinase [Lewinella sp. W8]MTB51789.1 hypothetical protein [Lewinella sp. W8]
MPKCNTTRYCPPGHFLIPAFLCLLLCGGASGVAQSDTIHHFFSLEQGIPHRTVQASTQQDNGLIWLSTDAGLSRFDGHRFVEFTEHPQQFVGPLHFDDRGFLICQPLNYPDSIEIFNPQDFTAHGVRLSGLRPGVFAGMFHRDHQPLYFANGAGIFKFSVEGELRQVHSLYREIQLGDRLLYADERSFSIYRPETNQVIYKHGGVPGVAKLPFSPPFDLLHQDASGTVWASKDGELYRKKKYRRSFDPISALPSGRIINFSAEDAVGNLLFANITNRWVKDMIKIRDDSVRDWRWQLQIDSSFTSLSGTNFEKQIRVNSYFGLYIIDLTSANRKIFTNYFEQQITPGRFGHIIRGFAADNRGNVYTNKDSKDPWWPRLNIRDGSIDTMLIRDNQNRVVNQFGCGTQLINYRGDIYGHNCRLGSLDTTHLYRYRPADDSWKRWEAPVLNQKIRGLQLTNRPGEFILALEDARDLRLGKLLFFDLTREVFTPILPHGEEALAGSIRKATFDSTRNTLWIASSVGLYEYNLDSELLTKHVFDNLRTTHVLEIVLIKDGNLLVGTLSEGLFLFEPATKEFTLVGGISQNRREEPSFFIPLPSDDVAAAALTKDDYLLISTFNGLVLHGGPEGMTYVFNEKDGLPSNEFNTPSLFYNEASDLWYAGTINGFTEFSLDSLLPPPSPHRALITGMNILDEKEEQEIYLPLSRVPTKGLSIAPSVIYFTLELSLPDFRDPGEVSYQTRLRGYDPDWTPINDNPTVRYTRLPPGYYTFELRAFDARGQQAPEVISFPIRVRKHWTAEYWFYALLMVLAVLAATAYYRWKLREEKRKMAEKKAHEQQVLELELRALRQQLNPHFLANAMYSIRRYILKKDRQVAADYLRDFTLLMRQFLESSRSRFTKIEIEVSMLKRYVRLEQLRHPGKFSFKLLLDPNIEPGYDDVPSLLMQPIVENAITHGLFNLPDTGELTIAIYRAREYEDMIVCTVTDNGIGRRAAEEIKQNSADKKHISRATQILKERQALLATDDTVTISLFTEDLYPDQEYTGTRVTLHINYGEEPMPSSPIRIPTAALGPLPTT